MRRLRDSIAILRAHVVERRLRSAPRAQDITEDPSAQPRMSHGDWLDSCGLVRGVWPDTLRLLDVLWCESPGVVPRMVYTDTGLEVQAEWIAKPYTLAQAALAFGITAKDAGDRYHEALEKVADNMVRRMQPANS